MRHSLIYLIITLLGVSSYAQSRPAGQGDHCVGSIQPTIHEVMPELMVYNDIGTIFGFGAGQVVLVKETISAQVAPKCRHRRHVIVVELDLHMRTEIIGLGVLHPYNGQPRTQAGIERSKEHEAMHRANFRAAFNRFKSRLEPPTRLSCGSYPNMMSILTPIKTDVENEWRDVKTRQEGPPHDTDQWREWYRTRGPIW